jgi:hypothetical protein
MSISDKSHDSTDVTVELGSSPYSGGLGFGPAFRQCILLGVFRDSLQSLHSNSRLLIPIRTKVFSRSVHLIVNTNLTQAYSLGCQQRCLIMHSGSIWLVCGYLLLTPT